MKGQCCKTCIYSRWWLTDKGNIHRNHSGQCLFKVELPPIPWSMKAPNLYTTGITPKDGEDCPVYERNEGPLISETNRD